MKATLFKNFTEPVDDMSLILITKHIVEGKWKDLIDPIRSFIAEGKFEDAESLKRKLPAFTPSGTFKNGRKAELLDEYSHFVVLDIDGLTVQEYDAAFEKIKKIEYTFCAFRSPSGNGIKILVQVSSCGVHHLLAFNQVANFYEEQIGISIDRSGKDVSRLCFVSFDPDAFKNLNRKDFTINPPLLVWQPKENEAPNEAQVSNTNDAKPAKYAKQFQECINQSEKKFVFTNGNRNNFVHYLSCNCNRLGIPQDVARQLILDRFNYDDKEVKATIKSAYENNPADFARFANFATERFENENYTDPQSTQLSASPCIPDEVFARLPETLINGCNAFTDQRERDIFLTGALTILSGCFTSVSGTYDNRIVYPNLYCFIIAPAASGKGALVFAKKLGDSIHNTLLQNSQQQSEDYELQIERFKHIRKDKNRAESMSDEQPPQEPKFKVLYIPANSSTAAVMYHLEQSDGKGIICETEADTLGNTFKQDWGGYSDLLRKAFQHESVSSSRKTNREYIQVSSPRLSVALSGTPSQVLSLISSAEDGLFSRFIFYSFKSKPQWRDVSPGKGLSLTKHFDSLTGKVKEVAGLLNATETIFTLSPDQWQNLNQQFEKWLGETTVFVSEDASSSVKRLGLITFRIAMVLSILRNGEQGIIEESIICEDVDFNAALALADVFLQHAILMFKSLPKSSKSTLDPRKRKLYEALPSDKEFSRKEAVEIGGVLNIKPRTVDDYLSNLLGSLLTEGEQYGHYRKT